MTKKKAPLLELEIELEAEPEHIWAALTEPQRLASWFPMHSRGEARAGARVLLSWGTDCEWETHITAFEPQRHLQWMDVLPEQGAGAEHLPAVDFYLSTSGGKTVLRLVQSGFDGEGDWQGYYDATRRGWLYFLDLLGVYLTHHFDQQRAMVWRRGKMIPPRHSFYATILSRLGIDAETSLTPGMAIRIQLDNDSGWAGLVRQAEPDLTFAAAIEGLGHASLFIEIEGQEDHSSCGIWLSTYGLGQARVEQLQAALDQTCQDLLQGPAAS